MKKFYKIVLGSALICMVLGFGLLTVGAAQGGVQLFLNMCDDNEFSLSTGNLSDWDDEKYGENEYTFSVDEVKSLDFDIGASVMEIKREDVEEYQIKIKNNIKYGSAKCYAENGVLHIDTGFDYWGVDFGKNKANKVTLVIPKKAKLEDIEFSLGAGSCTGDSMNAEVINVEIGAGNLNLKKLQAEKDMELSIGAGNAEIDKLEAKELKIECEAGRCYAKETVTTSDIDMNCDAGYIYLNLQDEKDSYNYDLECSVGSIKIDGKNHSGLDFSKETDHGANKELVVECNVGSVEIEFDK